MPALRLTTREATMGRGGASGLEAAGGGGRGRALGWPVVGSSGAEKPRAAHLGGSPAFSSLGRWKGRGSSQPLTPCQEGIFLFFTFSSRLAKYFILTKTFFAFWRSSARPRGGEFSSVACCFPTEWARQKGGGWGDLQAGGMGFTSVEGLAQLLGQLLLLGCGGKGGG